MKETEDMATTKIRRIPVHKVPAGTMLAELDQKDA